MRKFIALIICTLFLAGSSNAELVIAKKNLEWNIGDYVKYEIMGDTFATDFGKSIGGDDFLEVENFNGTSEDSITGMEIIELNNQTYDCHILKRTLSFSFTMIFKEGSGVSDDEKINFEMEYEYNIWQEDIFTTLKSEYSFNYYATWLEDGETATYELIQEDDDTHIERQGSWPESFEVGSSWTLSQTTVTSSTTRDRSDGGEWEVNVAEYEEAVTDDYVIIDESKVTTAAGTFDTLILKNSVQGDGVGNYTFEYINSDFLSVKREVYEDSEIILTMQIKEYSISSLESQPLEDGDSITEGLPNLSFLLSVSSIVLIAIVSRVRMN